MSSSATNPPQEVPAKRELNSEDVATANKKQKLPEPTINVKTNANAHALTGRDKRLEQNRRAARSSRNRKKVMVEELQRSIVFFSRANGSLRQKNEDLTRQIMEAQINVAAIEGKVPALSVVAPKPKSEVHASVLPSKVEPSKDERKPAESTVQQQQQESANAIAAQAILQQQQEVANAFAAQAILQQQQEAANAVAAQAINVMSGFPSKTPAKGSTNASGNTEGSLPDMKLGSTMQAMSEFQQATSVAVQMAMAQMQSSVPALSVALPNMSPAAQAQQDYLTALAMQQAVAMRYFQPFLMAQQQQLQQQQQQQQQQPQAKEQNKTAD